MMKRSILFTTLVLGQAACSPSACDSARSPVASAPPVKSPSLAVAAARPQLRVPFTSEAPKIDGELAESTWRSAARTGAFQNDGREARPYSEARFMTDGTTLYVGLYAADENIQVPEGLVHDGQVAPSDAFVVRLTPVGQPGAAEPPPRTFEIDVAPSGVLTDFAESAGGKRDLAWESAARVAIDEDGSTNNPSDDDEEWIVEMALPLSSLGLRPGSAVALDACVSRVDVLKSETTLRHGAWGGVGPCRGPGGARLVLTPETAMLSR